MNATTTNTHAAWMALRAPWLLAKTYIANTDMHTPAKAAGVQCYASIIASTR
jgi:hypothetical protein